MLCYMMQCSTCLEKSSMIVFWRPLKLFLVKNSQSAKSPSSKTPFIKNSLRQIISLRRDAMSSSSDEKIVSTLIDGIQLIATILPLLGTDEWSEQLSSALTRGYIYAAAAPMSVFGGLGVVRAGFMTFLACFSFRGIEGANILMKLGFMPEGENLSLIMLEVGGENAGHYVLESRMDKLIKELNIDKTRITGVSHKSTSWNFKMMVTTALLCAFGITPYIFLNLSAESDVQVSWAFPILRFIGSLFSATLIQLLLQERITTLSNQYLFKRNQHIKDVEAAGEMKKYQMVAPCIAPTWLLLFLLLMGFGASVVGYFGCYSVSTGPPIIWVFLESALSLIRSFICAYLPTSNSPPLKILLQLDEYTLPPTCNKDNEEILQHKMLPLTRAQDFLKIITSFAGLIEPFNNSNLSLYYTLTRKRPFEKSTNLGECILYITVFDPKGHTTRVYTRDNGIDTFYSTKPDAPFIDVGHSLREVEIDVEIDPEQDTVASDSNNLDSLRKHHQSILEQIQYRLGATDVSELYAIENGWTMKVRDTIGTFQRSKKENGDDVEKIVEKGKEDERTEESLASGYSMHSSIERERRLLDEKCGNLIARRNSRKETLTKETKERSQGEMEVEYRANKQEVEKKRNGSMCSIESIQE